MTTASLRCSAPALKACLEAALPLFGLHAGGARLIGGAVGPVDAAAARTMAREAGLDVVPLRPLRLEDALPCMAWRMGSEDPLLLARAPDGRVVLHGSAELTEVDRSTLQPEVWQLRPLQLTDARANDLQPAAIAPHWLREALQAVRPWYRDLLLAALFVNIIALVVPLFSMNVYDRVVPNQAFDSLWVLALAVVVAVGFDSLLRGARAHVADLAGKVVDHDVSRQLFGRVLGMRLEHRPQSVATFAKQIQEFDSVRDFFTSATLVALVDLPFALIFMAVIAWLGGWLVVVPLFATAALFGWAWVQQRKMKAALDDSARYSSQRQALLVENLMMLTETKQLNAQGAMQLRWEQTIERLADCNIAAREASNSLAHAAANSQQLVNIGLVVMGVYLIAAGQLSMGGLIAVTMLAGRAAASTSQIAMLMMRYQQTLTALKGLEAIMALPQENRSPSGVDTTQFQGGVRLAQASFSYPQSPRPALAGVNLSIEPGERVAIVGNIGAGKSTLLALLANQYQPTEGRVYFDGLESRLWPVADLRRRSAWLGQQPWLVFGSVLDNLLLGQTAEVPETRFRAALQQSGLSSFIEQLENGLACPVGELGGRLSGGQRQSVALARALLRNPALLLLDEPTSAMDQETEQQVLQGLSELPASTTLVIATHRPQLLTLCNRIIVVDGGRVVADGPREAIRPSIPIPVPVPVPAQASRVRSVTIQRRDEQA